MNINKMANYTFHTGRVIHKQIVGTLDIFTDTDDRTLAAFRGIFEYVFPGLKDSGSYPESESYHPGASQGGVHTYNSLLKVFQIVAVAPIGIKDGYIVA